MSPDKIKELIEYEDIPYTLVGNTALLDEFSLTLTAEGITAIAKQMKKGDLLKIRIGRDAVKYLIIKRG